MSTVTLEDRNELERLLTDFFRMRGENVGADVVPTLRNVGCGYLERSQGFVPPISRATEREQLAAYLGGTYLQGTRPSPNNSYAGLLLQLATSYVASKNPTPPVSATVLPVLVTLAMGATRETDPRATRGGVTVHFIDLYVEGR